MSKATTPEQVEEYLRRSETPLLLVMMSQLEVASRDDLPISARQKILQDGFSGAAAFYKALSYLSLLRQIEDARFETGRSARILIERSQRLSVQQADQAEESTHAAFLLSGEIEVWWNLWVICASHVHTYLGIAARAARVKTSDLDQIARPYHELRDKMEHLEERVRFTPGSQKRDGKFRYSVKLEDDTQVIASMQWELDEMSRVILDDMRVDVTGRGLDRFESAVERLYEQIRTSCLDRILTELQKSDYGSWALDIVFSAQERFRIGVGNPGQGRGLPGA